MLKHLQKIFKPAQAATVKEEVQMVDNEGSGVALAAVPDIGAADLASMTASFLAVTEQLAATVLQVTELTAALAAVQAEKETAAASALATKMTARKALVVNAIGTERADAFMTATAGMADEAFGAVMAAMVTTVKAESSAELFVEVGVDASADMTKVAEATESNPTMDYLQAKYANKKAA